VLLLNGRKRATYYAHSIAVDRNNVLDCSIALRLVQAVAAGLVERSEILGIETGDIVLATKRVILEDLFEFGLEFVWGG
tara:strand:- start:108 stop:344 length:237 start_codon:yes stop_codon:yes gene_type:complete